MDIVKFREDFVKIEFLESANSYGHHPFQLFVVTADDENEINALVGLEITTIIDRVKHYIRDEAKDIFLSLDLPKCGDIPNDFILVIHLNTLGDVATIVIEYNPETGEIIQETNGEHYGTISVLLSYFSV